MLLKATLHRCFLFVEIDLNLFMRNHKHLFVISYTKLFMRKKKSSKEIGQKEKKSRAKYECRSTLAKLIKIANLVPTNIQLRSVQSITEEINARALPPSLSGKQDEEIMYGLIQEIFKECFRDFSEDSTKTLVTNNVNQE